MKKDEKMSIEDMTAYMRIVPERKASYAEFPDTMNAGLRGAGGVAQLCVREHPGQRTVRDAVNQGLQTDVILNRPCKVR